MITHTVIIRLAARDPDTRAEHAAEYKRRLENLSGRIPGLLSLAVGIDVGRVDGHWDLALVTTHPSYDDLESYQAHPLHQEVIEYAGPVVTDRACVDHET